MLVAGASGFTGALAAQIVWRHPRLRAGRGHLAQRRRHPARRALPALPGAAGADRARPRARSRASTPRSSPTRTAPRRRPSPPCAGSGVLVVDLSADFRLRDLRDLRALVRRARRAGAARRARVYGLTEMYREELREAELVATPGCYPTASVLGLAPLAEQRPARATSSSPPCRGSRAPGAAAATRCTTSSMDENAFAYKTEGHRHRPEIEQELAALGSPAPVTFVPAPAAARPGRAGQLLRPDHRADLQGGGAGALPRALRRRALRPRRSTGRRACATCATPTSATSTSRSRSAAG